MARKSKFDKLHAIILRESKQLEDMQQAALAKHDNVVIYKEYHRYYKIPKVELWRINQSERRDNVG